MLYHIRTTYCCSYPSQKQQKVCVWMLQVKHQWSGDYLLKILGERSDRNVSVCYIYFFSFFIQFFFFLIEGANTWFQVFAHSSLRSQTQTLWLDFKSNKVTLTLFPLNMSENTWGNFSFLCECELLPFCYSEQNTVHHTTVQQIK